jgi:hypothetical protein
LLRQPIDFTKEYETYYSFKFSKPPKLVRKLIAEGKKEPCHETIGTSRLLTSKPVASSPRNAPLAPAKRFEGGDISDSMVPTVLLPKIARSHPLDPTKGEKGIIVEATSVLISATVDSRPMAKSSPKVNSPKSVRGNRNERSNSLPVVPAIHSEVTPDLDITGTTVRERTTRSLPALLADSIHPSIHA